MNKKLLTILLSVILPTFLVGAIVYSATSVGTNISVEGDLDIAGGDLQATTGTLNISKPGSMTTVEGTLNVDEAVTLDSSFTQTTTSSANTYDTPFVSTWITGTDMAGGGAYVMHGKAYINYSVENAGGARGVLYFDGLADDETVNQARGVEGAVNLNDTHTLTVTDDISAFGAYIGGTADVVATTTAGMYSTMNGAKVLWNTTKDFSIETNGVLVQTHALNYLDYGLHVRNSAEMIAGIYLDNHTSNSPSTIATGILMTGNADSFTTGIDINGAITGINIDGVMTKGIDIAPTLTADTTMTPINIAYSYDGFTNTGSDIGNYGIRSTITQTGSNSDILTHRGYIQGMRSDVTVNGFVDDAYSLYAKMSVTGASTANQLYGLNSVVNTGSAAITMDGTGNIAGVGISMVGSGNVTCGGTGYGKVSGMYIAWNESNAMAVDTAGIYIGNFAGMNLDAGFRINSVGDTVSAFYSESGGGTVTNGLKLVGAHTNAFAFPAVGTAPVIADTDGPATNATTTAGKIKITVNGVDNYIYYYDN